MVILGELLAIAVAGATGAIWPELNVFRNPLFVAIAVMMAISLTVVVYDQLLSLARSGITTRRLGSVVLHIGLIAVIVAGICRSLFAAEAVVDLLEGETLPPSAAAWTLQTPGWLAQPFHLQQPVTLEAVHGQRYADGSLSNLTATLSAGKVAVNQAIQLPGGRLFLSSDFAPAALIEWSSRQRTAILLDSRTRRSTVNGPDGLIAHLYADSDRSGILEVRIMKDNGLVFGGTVSAGESIRLPGGTTLTLHGVPLWARLRGSRDHSLWLAYAGFASILIGTILLFTRGPLGGPRFAAAARLFLLVLVLTGCNRISTSKAREIVTRYNTIVAEAYRRADVRLIDPVVGPNEGKKLTGFIGVRTDMGLTLDSELLSLDIISVKEAPGEVRVTTTEQWRYRDRRIGTGEQVGEESTDSYEMLYVLKYINKSWRVDEIQFAKPPFIGRKQLPWRESRETAGP